MSEKRPQDKTRVLRVHVFSSLIDERDFKISVTTNLFLFDCFFPDLSEDPYEEN